MWLYLVDAPPVFTMVVQPFPDLCHNDTEAVTVLSGHSEHDANTVSCWTAQSPPATSTKANGTTALRCCADGKTQGWMRHDALVEAQTGQLLELLARGAPALVGSGLPHLDLDGRCASNGVLAGDRRKTWTRKKSRGSFIKHKR